MKTHPKIPRQLIPMTAETDQAGKTPSRKPRFSYLIATAFGLGYLKPAPGTWGSIVGVLVATIFLWGFRTFSHFLGGISVFTIPLGNRDCDPFVFFQISLAAFLGVLGVWAAGRVGQFASNRDPQFVVVDEVSGQQLTLLLGGFGPYHGASLIQGVLWANHPLAVFGSIEPNWKYLLLGFILFRAFDIWKPFPVRQAESLPGGWGIMADDWLAAIYAAAGLWIARWFGL